MVLGSRDCIGLFNLEVRHGAGIGSISVRLLSNVGPCEVRLMIGRLEFDGICVDGRSGYTPYCDSRILR